MTPENIVQPTKACEFCGETILAVAKKCKHCKSMLNGIASPANQEATTNEQFANQSLLDHRSLSHLEGEELFDYVAARSTGDGTLPLSKVTWATSVVRVIQENANQPVCPKCHSPRTTYNKQGFGFGKAAVGVLLTGGIGLLAGGLGKNKILITCMDCGNRWKAG